MIEKVKEWLNNSIEISNHAGESFKAKFELEIQKRKKLLETYKFSAISITPNKISGVYRVVGQNPDDLESCYIGNVNIFFEEDTWKAKWNISGYTHSAYGMLVASNILVFNYFYKDADGYKKSGIVAYTFLSLTIAQGIWIEDGFPVKGIEELRKLEDDEDSRPDSHDANMGFSLN